MSASTQDLIVTSRVTGKSALIDVSGEVDVSTCALLEEALSAAQACDLIEVDLASVTFIGSSGLACLLEAHAQAADRSAVVRIVGTSPPVDRLLEVTGADRLLLLPISRDSSITASDA